MPEYSLDDPEARLAALCAEQNAIEHALREDFLSQHVFHRHVLHPPATGEGEMLTISELVSLRKRFVAEKRGKNMGEVFDMALSPEYFDRIHVVELGLTERPGHNGELDGLKHEYDDLRLWMRNYGLAVHVLSREESGRTIESRESEIDPSRIILIRNRPLMEGIIENPQRHARFGIAKRMVFSMPQELLEKLRYMAGTADCNDEKLKAFIEKAMQLKSPGIDAIRTGYYLVTEELE